MTPRGVFVPCRVQVWRMLASCVVWTFGRIGVGWAFSHRHEDAKHPGAVAQERHEQHDEDRRGRGALRVRQRVNAASRAISNAGTLRKRAKVSASPGVRRR